MTMQTIGYRGGFIHYRTEGSAETIRAQYGTETKTCATEAAAKAWITRAAKPVEIARCDLKGAYSISLRRTGQDQYAVEYGHEITLRSNLQTALWVFNECVRHAAACADLEPIGDAQ